VLIQNSAQGTLVHYVSALKIKGIGKKNYQPHAISFLPYNVAMATQHPSLLSGIIAYGCVSEAASLSHPRIAFVKHFFNLKLMLYAVEELFLFQNLF
jgi:hypothetical protein